MSKPHIAFERLADLAEGRLKEAERREALAHTRSCERCSAELARLESVINLMRTDESLDAPRDLVFAAKNLFKARAAESRQKSLASRILAALSFDSGAQLTPAFGLRSGQSTARQLLYSAGESDLDLRLTPAEDDTWVVSGQVLGECYGGEVELQSADGTKSVAELNEVCEFRFEPVSAGSYTLRLRLGEMEIEVPELKI